MPITTTDTKPEVLTFAKIRSGISEASKKPKIVINRDNLSMKQQQSQPLARKESIKSDKKSKKIDEKMREKINRAMKEKPSKSNRGPPKTDLEKYITQSKKQIKEWEEKLKNDKSKSNTKEWQTLYNKKTALKQRVYDKLAAQEEENKKALARQRFETLSELFGKKITMASRAKILNRIKGEVCGLQKQPLQKKRSSQLARAISEADFVRELKNYVIGEV